jgi:hypothetical protein
MNDSINLLKLKQYIIGPRAERKASCIKEKFQKETQMFLINVAEKNF